VLARTEHVFGGGWQRHGHGHGHHHGPRGEGWQQHDRGPGAGPMGPDNAPRPQ
jgi:hypothetical protein